MSFGIALPNSLVFEIDSLGLPAADKVAFGSELLARLHEFP